MSTKGNRDRGNPNRKPGIACLKWAAAAAIVFGLAGPGASAVSYYFFLDVPANLNGTDYTDFDVLQSNNGHYSVALSGGGLSVLALERESGGNWLAVLESATDLPGGVFVGHHDVLLTDGVNPPVLYLDGSAAGIPDYAGIDALFMEDTGDLIFSFDVPVKLAGAEYSASDLVRYSGGVFSLLWDAEAAGVPAYANVVGADRDASGTLVFSFDVPVNLGVEYLPGTLVAWTNPGFASYFVDGSWPRYAKLRDFAFVPSSGQVPGDQGHPGTPLSVTRNAATGELTLSWGTSCLPADTDFEVYEGTMGPLATQGFYTHTQKFCTTGGLSSHTFLEPGGAVYYLVVPRNPFGEGSYGQRSNLAERPVGISACLPQSLAGECP